MASKYESIQLSGLKTISISERKSKVDLADFAGLHTPGGSVASFLDSLPNIFAGKWIRTVVERTASARAAGKPVVVSMGAHVIKCGLSPIVCDLIHRGVITALAVNGAGVIHDSEVAFYGKTSEDVVEGMRNGLFGMARETADFVNDGAKTAVENGWGFGESLGKLIAESDAPNKNMSILAAAYECDVPMTVHVCVGCDIVHMHPGADGASIGEASLTDFRILTAAMKELGGGGVLMNWGSAVVLPEVVLKAITTLVNLGHDMSGMTGVNLDFVQHYRSNQQIVARIREIGGEGYSLTGHHEIMIPLIAAGVMEQMEAAD